MIARLATRLALATAVLLVVVSSAPVAGLERRAERTMYVTVLGPEGPMLTGIAAEDFRVREDNVEREVTGIRPAEGAVSAVLMIDTTRAANGVIQELRKAVVDYAEVLFSMSPGSRLALAEFAGVGMITQRFTSSFEEIQDRAQKIVANTDSGAVLNEGLVAASEELAKEDSPRRAIVIVNMEPTGEQSTLRIPNVAATVRDSGATVFSIVLLLSAERDANRDALLNGITTNSGGLRLSLNSPTALSGLLGTIAAISAAQWAVTFSRPDGEPAAERTDVLVMRSGVRVLTNAWLKATDGRPPSAPQLDVVR